MTSSPNRPTILPSSPGSRIWCGGRVLLVEDRERAAERIIRALEAEQYVERGANPARALLQVPDGNFDFMIVSLSLENADGLRLCSQVRSLDRTRHLPIMIIVGQGEEGRLLSGLDMGVNDYIVRLVDANELLARVRTQIKRKRYTDHLRAGLEAGGDRRDGDPRSADRTAQSPLHDEPLEDVVRRGGAAGQAAFGLLLDIDHFKSINDSHGHDAGDSVLHEFAMRLKRNIRGIDLACRLGGEEFVVVMPDTDLAKTYLVGERLWQWIATAPFFAGERVGGLDVTASVGVAALEFADDTPELILKRPDQAFYCAKRDDATGRRRRGLRALLQSFASVPRVVFGESPIALGPSCTFISLMASVCFFIW